MQSYIDFHNHQTKRTEERNNQRGILHNNSILVLSYLKSIIQGTKYILYKTTHNIKYVVKHKSAKL